MGMKVYNGNGDSIPVHGGESKRHIPFVTALAAIAVAGVAIGFLSVRGMGENTAKTGTDPDFGVDQPPITNQAPLAANEQPIEPEEAAAVIPAEKPVPRGGPAARRAALAKEAGMGTDPGSASVEGIEAEASKAPPMPFKTRTEQLISMVESIPPGVRVPPLPVSVESADLEADADQAEASVIEITEDDSDRAAAHKEKVGWTKLDLAAARKEGWTTVEYLKALEALRNDDADFARAKREEFDALLANPDLSDDECLAELENINVALEERGLPKIEPRFEE